MALWEKLSFVQKTCVTSAGKLMQQAGMLYPFFGFILTGFLIAFLRKVNKLMVALRIHDMERIEEAYRTLNLKPEAYDA